MKEKNFWSIKIVQEIFEKYVRFLEIRKFYPIMFYPAPLLYLDSGTFGQKMPFKWRLPPPSPMQNMVDLFIISLDWNIYLLISKSARMKIWYLNQSRQNKASYVPEYLNQV